MMDRSSDSDRPERRTALIAKELARAKIDLAALSETRRAEEGQEEELGLGYTFFWKGKSQESPRIHGVGFAIRTKLVADHNLMPTYFSERLMSVRIPLEGENHATIFSAYAPTLDKEDEEKFEFYDSLRRTISAVPPRDKLLILGDFNARVGRDFHLWKDIIGREGVGNCNSNGSLLLGLCSESDLSITNTFFRLKNRQKTTWQHPRSKHWHLIDYIITRTKDRSDFLVTKAVRSVDDCWTDHRLVMSKLKLKLKRKPHAPVQEKRRRFDLNKLRDPASLETYRTTLAHNLTAHAVGGRTLNTLWTNIRDSVLQTAEETIGFSTQRNQDWFDENDDAISDLINQKRLAKIDFENNPRSQQKEARFKALKSQAQTGLRNMKNQWWIQKAQEIQGYADRNQTREFYKATRAIYGPMSNPPVPLKSADNSTTLRDDEEILNRWAEHFQSLLNRPSRADDDALSAMPRFRLRLEMTALPTLQELDNALDSMKNNKAAGPDGIPAELLKQGGPVLRTQLHHLVLLIWESRVVPDDLKNCLISTIFKKGDRSQCGNYRGISLLSTAGKVFAKILQQRLMTVAEDVLPESQCGFRPGRGTTDMIFLVRQAQEKSREQQRPLYMTFFDLEKAFDSVPRDTLWKVLENFGCPKRFVDLIRALHDGMTASVLYKKSRSPSFPVTTGVKQGCCIAPTLFSLYLAALLHGVKNDHPEGISIRARLDGGLFNLSRLKARTKTSVVDINECQYADDNAILAHSPQALQASTNSFVRAYERFGLTTNIRKTQVLAQSPPGNNISAFDIQINDQSLEQVSHFTYLGSVIQSTSTIDDDITARIGAAHRAFGRLLKRVFKEHGLRLSTKILVYRAVVITTLLYGSETWTLYRKNIKKLERFHQSKLRTILGVKWEDHITNNTVLDRTNMTTIESMIRQNQLRWLGHVQRMPDARLPKLMLFSELTQGTRRLGAPTRRYKDQIHQVLKETNIDARSWETIATDRPVWRAAIKEGASHLDANIRRRAEEKRLHRRTRALEREQGTAPPPEYPCNHCPRVCYSRLGLHSHEKTHQHRLHRGRPPRRFHRGRP